MWQAGRVSPPSATYGTGFNRETALQRLGDEHFDVLVVGGGITGAGVALDAASRGLRTALVEARDFASGTSSKSSKMVHGGIRYLQQRDFRLVYEALHERQRLLENAPHLVTPLPFLIPLFGSRGVVQKSVARAYSTALWTYDITGGIRIGKRHRRISKEEALAHVPNLRAERLVSAFLYFDARTDDARLTLAVARTAALHHGAVVANYVPVVSFVEDSRGKVCGAHIRDAGPLAEKTARPRSPEIEVRASVVVNATGVWTDELSALEEPSRPHTIRPAKGVHITVPRTRVPVDIAAVVPVKSDKRSIFIVPWPDGENVYLGTTDTDWDGSLEDPVCLPEDVDYLIDAANALLTKPIDREDVTGVWAGLRPLLAPSQGRHMSERTADLSRRHKVDVSAHGVVTVTGGKLTTYRKMAEDTVDAAIPLLDQATARRAGRCRTKRLPIIGAEGTADLLRSASHEQYGIDRKCFEMIVARHGGETPSVLAMTEGRPELLEPLVPGLPELKVEAIWGVREEMALTVDDLLSRRVRAVLRRAEDTASAALGVSALVAPLWNHEPIEVADEASRFAASARRDLATAGLQQKVNQRERPQ